MFKKFENFLYSSSNGIIKKNGNTVKLTKLQIKLLDYLVANPNTILSKETLMEKVWGRIVTDNTISKFISSLRGFIEENPNKPEIILTHFGQGFSFEGKYVEIQKPVTGLKTQSNLKIYILSVLSIGFVLAAVWLYFSNQKSTRSSAPIKLSDHVLILPTSFNQDVGNLQQRGFNAILQSTFNHTDNEGRLIFNQDKTDNNKTIEKFWQVDKNLMVLQSNVVKNGEIYNAVIQLSQGAKVLDETTISADNLNELLNNQINYFASYQSLPDAQISKLNNDSSVNSLFIEALGYKKVGNLAKAKEWLEQVLLTQDDYYKARLELAKINIVEKEYDKSLAQLNTLKATEAYKIIGTEIELAMAEIYSRLNENDKVIKQLTAYQVNHLEIGNVKKAKIKLQIGQAYLALGDLQNAMKFFKQTLLEIDERFNPDLYAQSLYGQGMVLLNESNDETVFGTFEKALEYAKLSGNLEYQVIILDEMAKMLWVGNKPDEGIALKEQALKIMEMIDDKSEVAKGLGTLAGFLIQSGRFTEAKKVNDRLGDVAKELQHNSLYLNYLHYDAVILLNLFQFNKAETQINKQYALAIETENHVMQLDNAFLEFELRLAKKNTQNFKEEWNKRTQLIQDLGFGRYQVYMDLYLARYYKQIEDIKLATEIFTQITEQAKSNNDIKILVDAQNELADMYLEIDANKSLEILNEIEKYNPNVNPYLEIKARTYYKLGKSIEALNLLNQAKLAFHEGWKVENQMLLEKLQQEVGR